MVRTVKWDYPVYPLQSSSANGVSSVIGGRSVSSANSLSRSIILTATAAMAGGTQLFEGAHLTGGNNTRFCCEPSKCRNYAFFVGEIIKYDL